MYKRYLDFPSYVKGGKVEPHWEKDDSSFWYSESDEPSSRAWRIDPNQGTKVRIQPPAITTGRKRETPSPDGRWIAFIKDFNLFLQSPDGEQTIQLTEDGTKEPAWRDYFRLVWSPDGSKLAARRNDYADVPCYPPLPDWLNYPAPVKCSRDTITGQPWPRTEVVIFDVENGGTVRIQPDEGFYVDYVYPVWRQDGSEFLIPTRNRSGAIRRVVAADVRTGETRPLLEDTKVARGRVESRRLLRPVGDNSGFIWRSERDDWNHIYLYDYDGRLVRRLTEGDFPVVNVIEIDTDERWVYFT